jgi:hypothetical protein
LVAKLLLITLIYVYCQNNFFIGLGLFICWIFNEVYSQYLRVTNQTYQGSGLDNKTITNIYEVVLISNIFEKSFNGAVNVFFPLLLIYSYDISILINKYLEDNSDKYNNIKEIYYKLAYPILKYVSVDEIYLVLTLMLATYNIVPTIFMNYLINKIYLMLLTYIGFNLYIIKSNITKKELFAFMGIGLVYALTDYKMLVGLLNVGLLIWLV